MHRAAGTVVLFFLTLQVLEFHTRRAAVRWGCSPRRFYFLFLTLLFLADPGNRARSFTRSRVHHLYSPLSFFPRPKNPLYCFT